jgi:uncharacterized protein YbbK (DUF523 family)
MGHRLYREALIKRLREKYEIIPICPEQLGGLPVPRCPCAVTWDGDKPSVVNRKTGETVWNGHDLTEAYQQGAEWACWMAEVTCAKSAYMLKQSPACDPASGVAARALRARGITVHGV